LVLARRPAHARSIGLYCVRVPHAEGMTFVAGAGGSAVDLDLVDGAEDTTLGPCLRYRWGRCRNKKCRYSHDDAQRLAADAAEPPPPPPLPTRSVASAAGVVASHDAAVTDPSSAIKSRDRNAKWRSVDFLLNGQSVQTQPYLKEFASAPWLPTLLAREGCSSLFNKRGRPLRKEVTEAFGVLEAVRRVLSKFGGAGTDPISRSGAVIVDACCGKGMGSLVLAQAMPESTVHAVDKDPRMDLAHFQGQDNVHFHGMDLHSHAAAELAARASQEAHARGAPLLFVGTHLCGALSTRLVELFAELPGPAGLVLAPCCLDKRRPECKLAARRLGVDPHYYWCLSLLMSLPVGRGHRRELLIDDDVLSERNTFVLAVRAGL